jgi:hypothetical protein
MIHISKIDIDQCSRADNEPPLWAWVTAKINGVEAKYRLTDEQITRLLTAAVPIVMEQVALVTDALEHGTRVVNHERKVVEIHPRDPAA